MYGLTELQLINEIANDGMCHRTACETASIDKSLNQYQRCAEMWSTKLKHALRFCFSNEPITHGEWEARNNMQQRAVPSSLSKVNAESKQMQDWESQERAQ